MNVARAAERLLDLAENAAATLAALLVTAGVVSVVVEVGARALADRSFPVVLDLNAIFVLYIPFLAGAWVLRRGGHITIDLLVPAAGGALRRLADAFVACVGVAVSAVIAYFGFVLTLEAHRRGLQTLGIVRIPEWSVIGVVPLGATLFTLEFFRQLVRALGGRPISGVQGPRESGVDVTTEGRGQPND